MSRIHSSYAFSLLSIIFLAALFPLSLAAKVFKFNSGGLVLGDFQADPVNFIEGKNDFYRGKKTSGLTVGASHRWAAADGFSYEFPTGPGVFDVDLIFAEVYEPAQGNGKRVFSVGLEDDIVLKNLDVYKEVGANKELTKSIKDVKVDDGALSITFVKGPVENPMVSGVVIKMSDGSDFDLGEAITGEGTGTAKPVNNKEYDHQAHAVAGGPYIETDFNNDGVIVMQLDGTLSHSHYNNPDTGESGIIKSYVWKVGDKVISSKSVFTAKFKIGVTEISLTVTDQTGDSATALTEVKALPSTAGGVYCYYYTGATTLPNSLQSDPKPDEGHSNNVIDFDDDEFPYTKKDAPPSAGGTSTWAARCISNLSTLKTKQYKLSVKYKGAGVALYVKGVLKTSGGASGGSAKTISTNVFLGIGATPIQILYYQKGDASALSFLLDDVVAPPSALGFKASSIIPTISSTSEQTVDPSGNGQMQITGTGFFNNPKVTIGKSSSTFQVISSNEIVVSKIPSEAVAGGTKVNVVVSNDAGVSNAVVLTYAATEKKGVLWKQSYLKTSSGGKYGLKQISSIAIGPDSKYYMGSLSGYVTKIDVNKNLVVTSQCTGPNLGDSRAILGIAFNYKSAAVRPYVTTNSLYSAFGGPFKDKVDGWANGAVETLISGCNCLCYEKKVVTGLPVSNHDHGVNALLFLPNGDLLIAIGGATNAGHNTPGNKLGGRSESPLTGAVVVAKLSKGAAFNGNVKYNQYTDPGTCKKTAGDVEVYAPGFRNSFGLTMMTNGEIWGTDNGGNFGYGDVSTGCNTNAPFSTKQYDEINKIVQGVYYGHPNRNRGGSQCIYQGGEGKPATTVVSSTNAIMEYTSNVFSGSLKGELVFGKYAASGSGQVWRGKVSGGKINEIPMADYSGLSMAAGLWGELIMPRVQQGFAAVLQPVYTKPSGPMVIAVSPRRSIAGATVFVSGENFAAGLTVKFGTKAGSGIKLVGGTGFFCKVPAGSGKVSVVVTVGGASSAVIPGYDFIYA